MSHSQLSDFYDLQQIGRGSFGTVFRARRKMDREVYVLKEIKLAGASKREIDAAVNECHFLAKIDSPYVIRYYDSFVEAEAETLWLVMEYATGGTLRELIVSRQDPMNEDEAWYYICQILLGVASIHSLRIIHRDIKSLNIFICTRQGEKSYLRNQMKVGDMGVSKELQATNMLAQTLVGSPYYLSPEICRSEKYNSKSDVWALGVTFYEMLNRGKHPFQAHNQASLIVKILKGKYAPLSESYSQSLRDLVYYCLRTTPEQRPDVFRLLALPVVRGRIEQYNLTVPPDVAENIKRAAEAVAREIMRKSARVSSPGDLPSTPQGSSPRSVDTAESVRHSRGHARKSSVVREPERSDQSQRVSGHSSKMGVRPGPKDQVRHPDGAGALDIQSDVVIYDSQMATNHDHDVFYVYDFDDDDYDAKDTVVRQAAPGSSGAGATPLRKSLASGKRGDRSAGILPSSSTSEVSTSTTRPETALKQKELDTYLSKDGELSKKQVQYFQQISQFKVGHAARNDLIQFFTAELDGKQYSETEIAKYVFGRIGYDQAEIIDVLRKYVAVQRERQIISQKINALLNQIQAEL